MIMTHHTLFPVTESFCEHGLGVTDNGLVAAVGRVEPPASDGELYDLNQDSWNDSSQQNWNIAYRRLRRASAIIGASTVAIDNKIEQAMDLVKSHLMFAVREEVEVLKEQIKDLLEKNTQLEYENSILKSAATPETLAKLQQSKPVVPTSSSTS